MDIILRSSWTPPPPLRQEVCGGLSVGPEGCFRALGRSICFFRRFFVDVRLRGLFSSPGTLDFRFSVVPASVGCRALAARGNPLEAQGLPVDVRLQGLFSCPGVTLIPVSSHPYLARPPIPAPVDFTFPPITPRSFPGSSSYLLVPSHSNPLFRS